MIDAIPNNPKEAVKDLIVKLENRDGCYRIDKYADFIFYTNDYGYDEIDEEVLIKVINEILKRME